MPLKGVIPTLCRLGVLCISIYMSVRIRLFAVINYGRVIHEFDPWFNYRATEYMAANGWDRFQVCACAIGAGTHHTVQPRRVTTAIVSFVVAPTNSSDDHP